MAKQKNSFSHNMLSISLLIALVTILVIVFGQLQNKQTTESEASEFGQRPINCKVGKIIYIDLWGTPIPTGRPGTYPYPYPSCAARADIFCGNQRIRIGRNGCINPSEWKKIAVSECLKACQIKIPLPTQNPY